MDDSEREKEALKESVAILERKANGLANEVEESRLNLGGVESVYYYCMFKCILHFFSLCLIGAH